jgi:hypothetical protein
MPGCCLDDSSALACAKVEGSKTLEVVLEEKRDSGTTSITERLVPNLQSPDEVVRGDAVRSLCPCHAGWEAFEQQSKRGLTLLR